MESLERGEVLAKQVLSQLSYTPTASSILRQPVKLVKKPGPDGVPQRYRFSEDLMFSVGHFLPDRDPRFAAIDHHPAKPTAK